MRAFAILALCLVASQANAQSGISAAIQCVSNHTREAVDGSFADIIGRVRNIGGEKNATVEAVTKQLQEIRGKFDKQIEDKMTELRNQPDECENESFVGKIVCNFHRKLAIVSASAGIAKTSIGEAINVLQEHASDFGSNRVGGIKNVISLVKQGLPALIRAARECF